MIHVNKLPKNARYDYTYIDGSRIYRNDSNIYKVKPNGKIFSYTIFEWEYSI